MLHVSLLGEQIIFDDSSGAATRSSRTVALVAYLAAHAGRPQARQVIAGLFWPESTEAQALTNLRRELHHLRQVLGREPSLVVTARDLSWRDTGTCRVDLRVFAAEREAARSAAAAGDDDAVADHAARAVAQYRGDLLPGLYDDWLLDLRAELERQCADLCDLLAAARARSGDLAGAVEAARRRIGLMPLEETGYRTLMRLQADLGDRAGALSTYHHCASVLERELGVSPDPATQQIFEELMAQAAPPADPAPAAALAGPARTGAAAAFLGRSAELAELQETWQAAAAGQPALVLVRGGAGVGKTRLVTHLAQLARTQRAVVSFSQCFGAAGRLALAPVADWLRTPAVQAAAETLDPVWRAEVSRLVPPKNEPAEPASLRAMADAWQRLRFLEGLARALLAAGRPTLLVLDNVQWCDQETLAFLPFFLGLDPRAPVLVAGTLRDDGDGEDLALAAWADRVRSAGLLRELVLRPFGPADTARLAAAVTGRELTGQDADLLQAATGGFPLYVIEAMRSAAESRAAEPGSAPVPAGDLAAVLRQRLAQTTPAAREVAGLAAATGEDFTLDLLTEASDLDAGTVVGAVDELWRRRIVRELGDGYEFSHDLLRDAAYDSVSPPRRWLLHRRLAAALELLHGDDTGPVAAQLAAHHARGGQPARAVTYYQQAAEIAAGRFAHGEAIRLYREALALLRGLPAGPGRDSEELAVLHAMAAPLNARDGYAAPELRGLLERSITLAESLGRTESLITGLVTLWTSQFVRGETTASYSTGCRALAIAEPGTELSSAAHFAVGGAALSLGRPAEAARHLAEAARSASDLWLFVGTRPDVHAPSFAAHAHWLLGDDEQADTVSRECVQRARDLDEPYCLAVALSYRAVLDQMRGDADGLAACTAELLKLCDEYGFGYYRDWALILGGWSSPDGSGTALARRGIASLRAAGAFARMPYWLSLLAGLLIRDGDRDAARSALDAAVAAAHAHDDVWWLPEVMRQRAALDPAGAAAARLRAAADLAAQHGSTALLRRCEQDLADLAGQADQAG
jgi:DNA-binding SARP family transcriptional activator